MATWDPNKAAQNLERHGVAFEDVDRALDGVRVEQADQHHAGRTVCFCLDPVRLVVLFVVLDWDDVEHDERIVTARRASSAQARHYWNWRHRS